MQAAPRQSEIKNRNLARPFDAPRAGSAEAKSFSATAAQTPNTMHPVQAAPRQRQLIQAIGAKCRMHPVQAAPRQSYSGYNASNSPMMHPVQAAPRQRNGNGIVDNAEKMHPVQAAPRQSVGMEKIWNIAYDAPRAGSAEAKC